MIKVLIIEDMLLEADTTKLLVEREFPGAQVTIASNVTDAERLIRQSIDSPADFDVVIADVHVPVREGEQSKTGKEWLGTLGRLRPPTLVIPTSAYYDAPEITSELSYSAPLIPKGGRSPERLVTRIAGWIVDQGLYEVFGDGEDAAARTRVRTRRGSTTFPLARLAENTRLLWRHLSTGHRERVLHHFDVIEKIDGSGDAESVALGGRA